MPAQPAAGPNLGTISLLGIPYDAGSSFLRGGAQAPPLIREALYSDSSNLWTEDGTDLGRTGALHDAGDPELPENSTKAFAAIESVVRRTLDLEHPLISLGGDHSITYPIVKAFASRWPQLTIPPLPTHPHLYLHFAR